MLCENESQLNLYNHYNTIVPNDTYSKDFSGNCARCNRLDEYTKARVVMCLQHSGGERVQHNLNFSFEFGDDNHLPNLVLK
jgi:hypothetical protein